MVKVKDFSNPKDVYDDGDSEKLILNYFKGILTPEEKLQFEKDTDFNWVLKYHLSPNRGNLLSWYPFEKKSNLLEVGAGCGALTGLFCEKIKKVTALELTKQRANIVEVRHKNKKNLDIIVGNLSDIKLNEKFDYVTCIGVLEYAGLYSDKENPHLEFLKLLKSKLKTKGKLLLAIENRFGLKYWSGCKEDHTGKYFNSLENYPEGKIRTFSKLELEKLVTESGMSIDTWYYPFPDYKFPLEIFSNYYLPSKNHPINNALFPIVDESNTRINLFDEAKVMEGLIENNQFEFFTNSFLIEVVNNE